MNDENPYESPQIMKEADEKHPTESIPRLAQVGVVLLFVCLGLFIIALLLTLYDQLSIDQTEGKPTNDSYLCLKYGISFMKIGSLSGIIGLVLCIPAIIAHNCKKQISSSENNSKSNG
jgi:hypothetical protein